MTRISSRTRSPERLQRTKTPIHNERETPDRIRPVFTDNYEDILDEDVAILREAELSVVAVNNERIAAARAARDQHSANEIAHRRVQQQKLVQAERQRRIENRQQLTKQRGKILDLAVNGVKRVNEIRDLRIAEIAELRKAAETVVSDLTVTLHGESVDERTILNEIRRHEFEIMKLQRSIEARRESIRSLRNVKAEKMEEDAELNAEQRELERKKVELGEKLVELDGRDDAAMSLVANPAYHVTTEFALLDNEEANIRKLEKRLKVDVLGETKEIVETAKLDVNELEKTNRVRKAELVGRRRALGSTFKPELKPPRPPQNLVRVRPMIYRQESTTHQVQRLAMSIARDIVTKLSENDTEIERAEAKSKEIDEENKAYRVRVEAEWKAKSEKIVASTKNLFELESVALRVVEAEKARDLAERQEMEMSLELESLRGVREIREVDKEHNVKRQTELDFHRSRVAARQEEQAQAVDGFASRKETIAQLTADVEKQLEVNAGYEASIASLNDESEALHAKFDEISAEANRLLMERSSPGL